MYREININITNSISIQIQNLTQNRFEYYKNRKANRRNSIKKRTLKFHSLACHMSKTRNTHISKKKNENYKHKINNNNITKNGPCNNKKKRIRSIPKSTCILYEAQSLRVSTLHRPVNPTRYCE